MDITKYLQQKAVYWAVSSTKETGGYNYVTGVEIDCRWAYKRKVVTDGTGREIVSRAEVLVGQDLDEEGYLYLGELDDLTADEKADPMKVSNAFQIKRFDKIPDLYAATFVRYAYL